MIKNASMKIDEALTLVGEFGLYQKRIYSLLVLSWIFSYPFMISSVFFMEVQDHRCQIPELVNDTYKIQSEVHRNLIDEYIPKSRDGSEPYDKCHLYKYNQSYVFQNNSIATTNRTRIKCSEWVYSTELFDTTVVSSNDLVCDRSYQVATEGTVFFLGVLIGSCLMGALSDLIGRRKALLLSTFVLFCSSMGVAAARNFVVYALLRFVIGFSNIGMTMSAYVIGIEWVGPSKRTMAGLVMGFLCPIGQLYITLASYLIRNWVFTQIAIAAPMGILFLMLMSVPESPRWLLSKGDVKKVEELLEHASRENGQPLPPDKKFQITPIETKENAPIRLVFTSRVLVFRASILFFNWIAVVMAYFALTFNVENLYGNFFLNFTIMVLVSIPAGLMPILTLDRFGRKRMHALFMMVGGFSCLITITTVLFLEQHQQWATTLFAFIGKFFVTAAFCSVYIVSAELFPTVVRNAAMGLCSSCSWIGAMVAPFIVGLADATDGNSGVALPMGIIGMASILAGFLTILLPETQNRELPETIEDAIKF